MYSPPPNEAGVVSNEQCTICKLPEMCLVYVANVLCRIQPLRACKQKPQQHHWQQLQPARDIQAKMTEKPGFKAIEPENKKNEVHRKTST